MPGFFARCSGILGAVGTYFSIGPYKAQAHMAGIACVLFGLKGQRQRDPNFGAHRRRTFYLRPGLFRSFSGPDLDSLQAHGTALYWSG